MGECDSRTSTDGGPEGMELEESIRRGTRWVMVAQLASQLVSLAVLGALYRLVSPDQFGLLGFAVPLLLLAKTFASFGLNVATVQRRQLTDGQLSTVFWFSLLFSTAIAMGVAGSGPLVAWFYRVPELTEVLAALAGTLVLAALGAQHQALLERKLQIGRLAATRLLAQVIGGGVAVAAALAGWGVWALVVQQYVELTALGVLVWWLEPWRPRRWTQGESAGELLQFGGFYSLSSLMFFFAQNADKVLLGWLLAWQFGASRSGQVALGLYSQAFNLMMKPVYMVSSPMTGVMLPALSRVAHQTHAFEQLVARFYRMVAILLFPCGVGLTIVAVDVMLVLGGPPWRRAGYLLMILAPTILVQGLLNIGGSVLAAAGRARALFVGALVTAPVMTLASLLGLWLGGLSSPTPQGFTWGVASCYSACSVLLLAGPYMVYCFRTVGVSPTTVLWPLLRPAAAAATMGALALATRLLAQNWAQTPLTRLLVTVAVGTAAYLVLARKELRWFLSQIRSGR